MEYLAQSPDNAGASLHREVGMGPPRIGVILNSTPLITGESKPVPGTDVVVNGYQAARYSTSEGVVGLRLEKRIDTAGSHIEEVVIDCSESQLLKGQRDKEERTVQVNEQGRGSQKLSPTYVLAVVLEGRKSKVPNNEHWVKAWVDSRSLANPGGGYSGWERCAGCRTH